MEIARVRYAAGGSQQDVLRAEVAVTAVDRELVTIRQDLAEARAMLAEQMHVSPEADLRTVPELPATDVPVDGPERDAANQAQSQAQC